MINAEKTFTKNCNLRSPGYVRAIKWVSEVWQDLDPNLIAESFDLCGITQSNLRYCHRQLIGYLDDGLRDMVVEDDGTADLNGFGEDNGNMVEENEEADELDSSSDDEQNGDDC